MTLLPTITLAHPATLIAAVFTPWIAVGIALLIGFFCQLFNSAFVGGSDICFAGDRIRERDCRIPFAFLAA